MIHEPPLTYVLSNHYIIISNLFELFFCDKNNHTRPSPLSLSHHDTRSPLPHLSLFLPTIVISNLFELFFRDKNTQHLLTSADTRHWWNRTMNRTTRSSPRQPRGSLHSPTYLYFCSLFLFQICLNYFSATKIHHIAQHRFPSVGPMLHRFHYIDLVTQKSPHCYDTKQSLKSRAEWCHTRWGMRSRGN